MSVTVCKVWDSEYPWDVRVEKVASALCEAGHAVHLVARNRRREPVVERLPEAVVHRLRFWPGLPRWLVAASMFPAFFNPRWVAAIHRVCARQEADLILCRDLPLAIPSILVSRWFGLPVILDMAEDYPAMLASRFAAGRAGAIDHLVRNPVAARAVERWVLPRVDGVLVMVPESAHRLRGLGVADAKITLVSNTPPLRRLRDGCADHASTDRLEVVYLGLLEVPRGLATGLEAVARLRAAGTAVRLTVIGDGLDAGVLRDRARQLGIDRSDVVFRGRIPNEAAIRELPSYHVGLVPHVNDPSWATTVPNKLFDYMAAGLAVITSDAPPAARIVGETGCGCVFKSGDAGSLADAVLSVRDPSVRRAMGEAGRRAIRQEYNWERDAGRLATVVERLAREGPDA